jgi:cytidylate kinase
VVSFTLQPHYLQYLLESRLAGWLADSAQAFKLQESHKMQCERQQQSNIKNDRMRDKRKEKEKRDEKTKDKRREKVRK